MLNYIVNLKGENMKRNLLFSGAIIGVVHSSLTAFLCFIYFFVAMGLFATLQDPTLTGELTEADLAALHTTYVVLLVLCIISVVIGIIGIVFNAKSISISKLPHDQFTSRQGTVITAIVFNFISLTMISIVGGILMIVDLAREKESASVADSDKNSQNNDTQKPQGAEQYVNTESKSSGYEDLEAKLNKIKALKDQNLLSEEEYEHLRADCLSKYFNK